MAEGECGGDRDVVEGERGRRGNTVGGGMWWAIIWLPPDH